MELKTPDEWCEIKGIYIMDPDGWRSEGDPAWDEPISEEEFNWRSSASTIGPRR